MTIFIVPWLFLQAFANDNPSVGEKAFKAFLATSTARVQFNPADESDALARIQLVREYTYHVREDRPRVFRADVSYKLIGTRVWDDRGHVYKDLMFAQPRGSERSYRMTQSGGRWIMDAFEHSDYFVLKQ